jgi:hypothetical protein
MVHERPREMVVMATFKPPWLSRNNVAENTYEDVLK